MCVLSVYFYAKRATYPEPPQKSLTQNVAAAVPGRAHAPRSSSNSTARLRVPPAFASV